MSYRVARAALIAAVFGLAGCSSKDEPATPAEQQPDAAPDATAADSGPEQRPDAAPVSGDAAPDGATVPSGCVETVVRGSDGSSGAPTYVRSTWESAARILTSESSSSPSFADVSTLKWKYAAEGRVIAYIGVEQPFQHDYRYDAHDNVIDFVLSYPENPDVNTPSTASPWMGTSYANEYDASGRLTKSTSTPYGGGSNGIQGATRVFTQDASGNCTEVDTTDANGTTKELRSYEAGKLVHVETTGRAPSMTDYTYDGEGRLLSRTYTAQNAFGGGQATDVETHEYLPDGSEHVKLFDGFTDVLSERYTTTTRSAACLRIDEQIGVPNDNRCRVR